MSKKDPQPQPGDCDADLAAMNPDDFEVHEGNPDAKVTVLPAGMDAEDVRRLSELARRRDQTIGEVLVELVRSA